MIRRPPRSTPLYSSAASDVYKRQTDVGRWMSANRLKLNKDKTELLWVGPRHSLSQQGCCLPVLQLGSDTITACDHVSLLGVTLSSDLCHDRHVSIVSASCFYWLRQLRCSRRSLDAESAVTLVHAFVASCIDYCNAVLACARVVVSVSTSRSRDGLETYQRLVSVSSRQKFSTFRSRLGLGH